MAQSSLAGGYWLPSTRKQEVLSAASQLPDYYKAKADKDYNDKLLALKENEVNVNIQNANNALKLQKQSAKQDERATNIGNALGIGKLGLETYFATKEPDTGISSQLFSDTGKTAATARPAGTFETQYSDGVISDIGTAIKDRPVGTGLGAIGGGLLGSKYADKMGVDETTGAAIGAVGGAVAGNLLEKAAAPAISYASQNIIKPASSWLAKTVGSWFGLGG